MLQAEVVKTGVELIEAWQGKIELQVYCSLVVFEKALCDLAQGDSVLTRVEIGNKIKH